MPLTRKLALALALASAASIPAFAGSAGKYDGAWSLSVITDTGTCDGYKWTVVVANNRLLRIEEMPISASGSINAKGQARFEVASTVSADGQMEERTGAGRWDAPSKACSGRWLAARL